MKRNNTNKIIYKNITRKTNGEKSIKENNSNDSIQFKNDLVKKNYSSVNNSEFIVNSVNKGKVTSKLSRQQSYKN